MSTQNEFLATFLGVAVSAKGDVAFFVTVAVSLFNSCNCVARYAGLKDDYSSRNSS